MGFAIHWHESAMDLHVLPIPILPPTSLPTPSLWRWNISFCFSLEVPYSLQSEQLPGGEGAEKEGRKREWDLEFIAGDLLCVSHLEGSAPQICNTTIGQRNDAPFYRWGERTSVQFDSASSSQLPSGMVQLWDWNQDSDQKWGISWLNLPSLHSFLNTFPPFLPPFHLPFLFLLSWDK